MVRSFRQLILIVFLILLQACAGFQDATLAVSDRGPDYVFPVDAYKRDRVLKDEGVATNPNPIGIFVDAYRASVALPNNRVLALTMAETGYDLVDHYCYQFFQAGGENQKWLNLSKDLVAAIGTLGTGISALAAHASGSATAIVALGTASAYNGIDIYSRNFLFGVENISSVRTLTVNALTAHRHATIAQPDSPDAPWRFGSALLQIEDHQALCQSAKIKELVLQAIKGGTATAFTPSGTVSTAGGAQPMKPAPASSTNPAAHVDVKAGS